MVTRPEPGAQYEGTIVFSTPTPTSIREREVDSPEAREKIDVLLGHLMAMPQVEIPLQHFFAHGVYARQGVIKKGTLLIGAIKKISHINIITSGDISIFTEAGEQRITGPATMVSAPGTKRVGYAHEDTVWTTIIGTDQTEVEKVEEQVLAKTYDDYLAYCNQLKALEA
jgi:hypothetical protein